MDNDKCKEFCSKLKKKNQNLLRLVLKLMSSSYFVRFLYTNCLDLPFRMTQKPWIEKFSRNALLISFWISIYIILVIYRCEEELCVALGTFCNFSYDTNNAFWDFIYLWCFQLKCHREQTEASYIIDKKWW